MTTPIHRWDSSMPQLDNSGIPWYDKYDSSNMLCPSSFKRWWRSFTLGSFGYRISSYWIIPMPPRNLFQEEIPLIKSLLLCWPNSLTSRRSSYYHVSLPHILLHSLYHFFYWILKLLASYPLWYPHIHWSRNPIYG